VARSLPAHPIREGDRIVVEVEVIASRRIGELTLEDRAPGLGAARFAVGGARPSRALRGRYEIDCRGRGVYRVGPALIAVGDPFGMFERVAPSGAASRLVVWPACEDLRRLPGAGGSGHAHRSSSPAPLGYDGEDFFTLREYQVGDDLRRVHWPASAKRDRLMIRRLEAPRKPRALVLLEVGAGRYPAPEVFEHAVRGAASVFRHLHRGGLEPRLWAGAPGDETGSLPAAMTTLAGVQPLPEAGRAGVGFPSHLAGAGGDVLVIVTGAPDHRTVETHRALRRRFAGHVVMAAAPPGEHVLAALRRAGVVTVAASPPSPWAPAWETAMEEW
jgi:uncharacterized protein (DUF58 family)